MEVPKGFVIIKVILELYGDDLIHSDQLSGDLFFNFLQVTITSFISGSFQKIFGVRIDVKHLFFADTKAHKRFGFSLDEFSFTTDIKALFVEVRGSFIVIQLFKLISNDSLLFQTLFGISFSVEAFSANKVLAELHQRLFGLLELALLSLVQFVFFL